jgi:alpha-tubulin suppressor-like RCC1 family protein
VRLTANDGKANGTPGVTSSFVVDNSAPAVSNLRVTRQAGSTFRILYDFSYPSVETTCSAVVFYSANDGPWTQSSQAPATGLTPGTDREITWNASSEGLAAGDNFRVRVRVSDSLLNGTSDQSGIFRVNNEPPTVAFTSLTSDPRTANGNYSGNLAASFTITDLTPNNSYSVSVDYTIDGGETWSPATADRSLVFNAPGNYEFIWESFHDYQGDSIENGAVLRIKCSDGETESDYANSSAVTTFTLKNNHQPTTIGRFVKADATITSFAVLDAAGNLFVWGQNGTIDIGAGAGLMGVTPATGELARQHIDIACTYQGVIALGADKTIRCVGNQSTQCEFGIGAPTGNYLTAAPASPNGLANSIVAIAAGPYHVLALHETGTVRAFGADFSGQLGDDVTIASKSTPVFVSGLTQVKAIAAGGIGATTLGYNHSLAIKNDGTVWAWGGNLQGQLGIGNQTSQPVPVEVVWFRNNGIRIKAIAAGAAHSLFLSEDGKVYHSGHYTTENSTRSEPAEIVISDDSGNPVVIEKVFAGGHVAPTATNTTWGTSYAIDTKGNVYVWGHNNSTARHFGLNSSDVIIASPTRVPGISRISAVATVKNTGATTRATAYCGNSETGNSGIWTAGAAANGMLGNGAITVIPASPLGLLYHQ